MDAMVTFSHWASKWVAFSVSVRSSFLSTVSGRESVEAFVPLLVRDSTYIRSAQPIGLRIAGRTQSFGSL